MRLDVWSALTMCRNHEKSQHHYQEYDCLASFHCNHHNNEFLVYVWLRNACCNVHIYPYIYVKDNYINLARSDESKASDNYLPKLSRDWSINQCLVAEMIYFLVATNYFQVCGNQNYLCSYRPILMTIYVCSSYDVQHILSLEIL
jgi:hypothetical protein